MHEGPAVAHQSDADSELLLAFDFGLRRVGIATANLRTRTASPLSTLTVGRTFPWSTVDRLVEEWRPSRLIVGMPADPESQIARSVRAFITALGSRYQLPVASVDESLTSRAAESGLREGRRSGYLRRRAGRGRVDRLAACLIAEQWMNSCP
jgi:putative holliday junction resolvase